MTDSPDNLSSAFDPQQQAHAGRDASVAESVLQRSDLWGYLEPVGESKKGSSPFFDFAKDSRRHTVKMSVPRKKDNGEDQSVHHALKFSQKAKNRPALIKNLSDILKVKVNGATLKKDKSCEIGEMDTVRLFKRSGKKRSGKKLCYDYVYREAFCGAT